MATTGGRRDIELDPRFLVPPGIIDVRQENKEDSYYVYNIDPTEIAAPGDGPILETPQSPIPNAPSRYTIVSQTVRTGGDGRSVVDLLLEFPDDVGTYDIDVRFTPA